MKGADGGRIESITGLLDDLLMKLINDQKNLMLIGLRKNLDLTTELPLFRMKFLDFKLKLPD